MIWSPNIHVSWGAGSRGRKSRTANSSHTLSILINLKVTSEFPGEGHMKPLIGRETSRTPVDPFLGRNPYPDIYHQFCIVHQHSHATTGYRIRVSSTG